MRFLVQAVQRLVSHHLKTEERESGAKDELRKRYSGKMRGRKEEKREDGEQD